MLFRSKQVLPFATTWIKLEDIILSEISQTEIEKYNTISFIFRTENLKHIKTRVERWFNNSG
jgi:hypothetical protein